MTMKMFIVTLLLILLSSPASTATVTHDHDSTTITSDSLRPTHSSAQPTSTTPTSDSLRPTHSSALPTSTTTTSDSLRPTHSSAPPTSTTTTSDSLRPTHSSAPPTATTTTSDSLRATHSSAPPTSTTTTSESIRATHSSAQPTSTTTIPEPLRPTASTASSAQPTSIPHSFPRTYRDVLGATVTFSQAQPSSMTIQHTGASTQTHRISYRDVFMGPPFIVGGSGGFDRITLSEEIFPLLVRPTPSARAGPVGRKFSKRFGKRMSLQEFWATDFPQVADAVCRAPAVGFQFKEADFPALTLPPVPTPREGRNVFGEVVDPMYRAFGARMSLKEFWELY